MARPRKNSVADTARRVRPDCGYGHPIIDLPEPLFDGAAVRGDDLFGELLPPEVDACKVARMLDLAVRRAITAQEQADLRVAPADERYVYGQISQHARSLLGALGYDGAGDLHPSRVLDTFAGAIRYSTDPKLSGLDLTEAEREEAAREILDLPGTLSLIASLARYSADKRDCSKAGDRPDVFRWRFFLHVWEAFESGFRGRPKARDSYKYTSGELVASARRIARHAANRLPEAHQNAVAALRQIADMTDRTIGDRLEEARRTHEKDRAALRPLLLEAIGTRTGL